MQNWMVYSYNPGKLPHFKLIKAKDIDTAELVGEEITSRSGELFIGVSGFPEQDRVDKPI